MFKWLRNLFKRKPVKPELGMKAHPMKFNEPNARVNRNRLRMERLAKAILICEDEERKAKLVDELERRERWGK